MAHSYVCQYIHCVFSTKGRQRIISPVFQDRLWPYVGGIARENKMICGGFGEESVVEPRDSVQSSLRDLTLSGIIKPPLKRWAIVIMSLRDKHPACHT